MRHVFIVNPVAGPKNSVETLRDKLKQAFPAGDYEFYETSGAGDARRLAEEAIARSTEPLRLYACGGDGTLNEVVNGAAGCEYAAVTNVPMGTGNDFLRLYGRKGRERFSDLAALRDGPQTAMDLIDCNGLLGINTVCAGVDARVAAEVHNYKRIPFIGKKMAYILSLIVNVFFKGITRYMRIHMGPHTQDGPTAILCVCNGQYYGGGFRPMAEARPDDGVLDMILVGDVSLLRFARYVHKYSNGRYKELPEDVVKAWHGDAVTVSSDQELVAVVDGEAMYGKDFTIRLSERKVNFFYPAGVEIEAET